MQQINWVDVLIIIFLIGSVGRGLRVGFFRQVFVIAGFFTGLLIGNFIMPAILDLFNAKDGWAVFGVLVTLFLAGQMAAIGDILGRKLRARIHERSVIEVVESMLGIFTSVASVLVAAWLLASLFIRVPIAELNYGIDQSAIVQHLNTILPSAPNVLNRFGKMVNFGDFPQVFVSVEPAPAPTGPASNTEVQSASNKARASTVKIQGFGCGGLVTGSGFVAGEGLVATNAHVVAGIKRPVVIDDNGRHQSQVVLINPELDFAVLRTTKLAGPALHLATEPISRGTSAAVVGYPGGGGYTTASGVVLARYDARGRNIYDTKITIRNIYEIQADVEPGNSGGPLVLSDGRVAGVVFARAVSNEGYGYALTAASIASDLTKASALREPVSSGRCAAD